MSPQLADCVEKENRETTCKASQRSWETHGSIKEQQQWNGISQMHILDHLDDAEKQFYTTHIFIQFFQKMAVDYSMILYYSQCGRYHHSNGMFSKPKKAYRYLANNLLKGNIEDLTV